jgi:hypothetical protein
VLKALDAASGQPLRLKKAVKPAEPAPVPA